MSDGPGSGRNYWQMAAKDVEEEKQMLLQQVTALTTERDNLASLVEELRAALEGLQWCLPHETGRGLVGHTEMTCPICGRTRTVHRSGCQIGIALALTTEQAGEKVRAERDNLASLVAELRAALETVRENRLGDGALDGSHRGDCTCSFCVSSRALPRSPEQAGARRAAEQRVVEAALRACSHTGDQCPLCSGVREGPEILYHDDGCPLAALEVKGAE